MQVPVEKDKKLLSIEFPGIVDDVDKAVRCLGGIETIEKVIVCQSLKLQGWPCERKYKVIANVLTVHAALCIFRCMPTKLNVWYAIFDRIAFTLDQ